MYIYICRKKYVQIEAFKSSKLIFHGMGKLHEKTMDNTGITYDMAVPTIEQFYGNQKAALQTHAKWS